MKIIQINKKIEELRIKEVTELFKCIPVDFVVYFTKPDSLYLHIREQLIKILRDKYMKNVDKKIRNGIEQLYYKILDKGLYLSLELPSSDSKNLSLTQFKVVFYLNNGLVYKDTYND